jgi:hypothetical protein
MKRATCSPLKKNAPSVPAFADVARFVAGSDAPPWLAAHFERWAPSLKVDRFVYEMQPTKAEMKKRLSTSRQTSDKRLSAPRLSAPKEEKRSE